MTEDSSRSGGRVEVADAVRNCPNMHDDQPFVDAWRSMEADGYMYSESNIEKVHMGWVMAHAALNRPAPDSDIVGELCEALGEARNQLEYMDERSPSGTTPAVISRIDAALAKATEARRGEG